VHDGRRSRPREEQQRQRQPAPGPPARAGGASNEPMPRNVLYVAPSQNVPGLSVVEPCTKSGPP